MVLLSSTSLREMILIRSDVLNEDLMDILYCELSSCSKVGL
jgi:hypothetical protein